MRRLLTSLALGLSLLVSPLAHAVNSVTETNGATGLPGSVYGRSPIRQKIVFLDVLNTDFTAHTPAAGNMVCVLGWDMSPTVDTVLTFKSGTSTIISWNLRGYQAHSDGISNDISFCTAPGQPLVVSSSALVNQLVIKMIELPYFVIN